MSKLNPPTSLWEETARTIVVVDDDVENGELLRTVIETETPYSAVLIRTAEETLQRLEELVELKPALFILDFYLPSMTGVELYDHLRSHKKLAHLPALLLTGIRYDEQFMRTLSVRKLEMLEKPFDLDALLNRIEQIIEQRTHLL